MLGAVQHRRQILVRRCPPCPSHSPHPPPPPRDCRHPHIIINRTRLFSADTFPWLLHKNSAKQRKQPLPPTRCGRWERWDGSISIHPRCWRPTHISRDGRPRRRSRSGLRPHRVPFAGAWRPLRPAALRSPLQDGQWCAARAGRRAHARERPVDMMVAGRARLRVLQPRRVPCGHQSLTLPTRFAAPPT